MTIVVGLTGGIASGKTTITSFLRSKKIPVHDSDEVVNNIYKKPSDLFIKFLKKNRFMPQTNTKKINKTKIREQVFNSLKKRKNLESFIHKEVKRSRDEFITKNKKTKIVFLDIPLLFEKKLEDICDYVVLLHAPKIIRKKRALSRKGMNKNIFEKIINTQLNDKIKKNKADFLINTNASKKTSYKALEKIIIIIKKNA